MSKIDTVNRLPSATGAQQMLEQIAQLNGTLAAFDSTLAMAINRMMEQGDALALEVEPLVRLRQQLTDTLSAMVRHSAKSCDSARSAAGTAEQAAATLSSTARALELMNGRAHSWFRYVAVSVLSVALLLGCVKAWPALAVSPMIAMDDRMVAERIAAELRMQCQQRQRTVQPGQ